MTKRLLIFTAFLICNSFQTFSQNTAKWNVLFGCEDFTGLKIKDLPEEIPNRISQTAEGNYYITGTNSLGDGVAKPNTIGVWVAHFSSAGKLLWWKIAHPNNFYLFPGLMCTTQSGDLIMGASTGGSDIGVEDDGISIFQISKNGTDQTEKKIPVTDLCVSGKCPAQGGVPFAIWENSDKSILMVVRAEFREEELKDGIIYNNLKSKYLLVTLTAGMTVKDVVMLPVTDNFGPVFCKNTPDGRFFFTQAYENSSLIYAFSSNGELLHQEEVKTKSEIVFNNIFPQKDNTAIMHICSGPDNKRENQFILFGTDSKPLSEKIKIPYAGYLCQIFKADNDFVVASQNGIGESQITLIKYTKDGTEKWKKIFGTKRTLVEDAIQTNDDGYAVIGYTRDYGAVYVDVLIIKTDSEGSTDALPKKYQKQ